ncbi:MAG: cytochrome c oxidase subunit 3 [Planctomycetia bacterium]|nr:cytochrome c oxidase subunit 3 [Planctomycetia bacterium]
MSASTHSSVLKHHFEDLGQQHACERLGIWMFLATEVLFFGGIFGAYTVYRLWYPHEFELASSHLNRTIATVNTVFLITSSLTMTLAIRAAKLGDRSSLIRNLLITAALGTAFMVMKGFEYSADLHERYVPGRMFQGEYEAALRAVFPTDGPALTKEQAEEYFKAHPDEHQKWAAELVLQNYGKSLNDPTYRDPGRVQLFLCFYYIMTGIHGLHIIIGIGCILWLVWEAWRGTIPPENYSTVEVVSLYWHLVDAIWLFLMPLLYLAGSGMHH